MIKSLFLINLSAEENLAAFADEETHSCYNWCVLSGQVKAAPQNRIIVSARFLKPIKEPCAIL